MSSQQFFINELGFRDAGFALAWLLALVLLVPVQLGSMIVFDSTGLDTLVPSFVFMALVPALVLTLFPALIARRLYTPGATRATLAGGFVVFAAVTAYTTQFYGMCGPGC